MNDRNGLYVLLNERLIEYFDRKTKYGMKLDNHIKGFLAGKTKKKIIFISDIGISGRQFGTAIDYYLKEENKSEKFYQLEKDVFNTNILAAKNIVLLNCVYTEIYEQKVNEYTQERFKDIEVHFDGSKLKNIEETSFGNLHEKDQQNFYDFITKYHSDLLERKLPIKSMTYHTYLQLCLSKLTIQDPDFSKTLLILRLRSLPKCHQLLFRDTIFDYRKDC